MYSAPCEKFTTVISPKISDRPMASRTKIPPSTSPVKICAASAASETSGTTALRESLLRAGAVHVLAGWHAGHDLQQAPVALGLAGAAALDDPHVLERLVVAGPPPLLALEVVVGGALPQ